MVDSVCRLRFDIPAQGISTPAIRVNHAGCRNRLRCAFLDSLFQKSREKFSARRDVTWDSMVGDQYFCRPLLFSEGPMKMPFADYIKDIGLTYLIIPMVTLGFGYLLQQKTT